VSSAELLIYHKGGGSNRISIKVFVEFFIFASRIYSVFIGVFDSCFSFNISANVD